MSKTIKEMILDNRDKLAAITGEYETLKEMAINQFSETLKANPDKIWPTLGAIAEETGLSVDCWSTIIKNHGRYYKRLSSTYGVWVNVPIKKVSKQCIQRFAELDENGNVMFGTITNKLTYKKGYGYDS